MMSVYSRSFPLLSFHFLYITEASTLAGEKVLGSLSREITLRRMVLGGVGAEGQSVGSHGIRASSSFGPKVQRLLDPRKHPTLQDSCLDLSHLGNAPGQQGLEQGRDTLTSVCPTWGTLRDMAT